MQHKISRREFLKFGLTLIGGGSLLLGKLTNKNTRQARAEQDFGKTVYFPLLYKDIAPIYHSNGSTVIHVHSGSATSWNYSTGWYGNYVSQSKVSEMVNAGLRQLTGQSTTSLAWQSLLPGYVPGKAIAIKVNFNNGSCNDTDNVIDGLVEPVNALIGGMVGAGVQVNDIWLYDAIRPLPSRFRSRCLYNGVKFYDSTCAIPATFSSNNSFAQVNFQNPKLTPRKISDVIINATYLINMPILKDHGIAGVTLGFKNHFGTINQIIRSGEDNLHYYIDPNDSHYSTNYNPLLDIFTNPNIRNKTILTVGDGLFGAYGGATNNDPPARWASFGNTAANSLFFSVDPVAIDCVMMDILDAEPVFHPKRPNADNYLKLAANAGLGVYERGSPWIKGYQQINYQKFEL